MAGGPLIQMATAPLRERRWPRRLAIALTLIYWWPGIGIDLVSLFRWGLTESSAQRTMNLLLLQSIVYLVIWGICAAVSSIVSAGPAEKHPNRRAGDRKAASTQVGASRDYRGR